VNITHFEVTKEDKMITKLSTILKNKKVVDAEVIIRKNAGTDELDVQLVSLILDNGTEIRPFIDLCDMIYLGSNKKLENSVKSYLKRHPKRCS